MLVLIAPQQDTLLTRTLQAQFVVGIKIEQRHVCQEQQANHRMDERGLAWASQAHDGDVVAGAHACGAGLERFGRQRARVEKVADRRRRGWRDSTQVAAMIAFTTDLRSGSRTRFCRFRA